MQRTHSLDLLRLIAAFFVVILHCNLGKTPEEVQFYLRLSGRWAVPFFFLVSGYLFAKGYARRQDVQLTNTLKKLLDLFVILLLVYLPLGLGGLALGWISLEELFTFRRLISGMWYHTWFVGAMIFGYLILWYFLYNRLERLLPILSCVLLALVLLSDTYSFVLHDHVLDQKVFRYLMATPFLYIGYFLSSQEVHFKSKLFPWSLIFSGAVVQLIESHFIPVISGNAWVDPQFFGGTTLLVLGVFILFMEWNTIPDNIYSRFGRHYSLPIYLYHPLFNVLFFNAMKLVMADIDPLLYISPLLSFIGTSLCLWLIDKKLPTLYKLLLGDFIGFQENMGKVWKMRGLKGQGPIQINALVKRFKI